MTKWKKLGRLFGPEHLPADIEWMNSHTANPIAENVEEDWFRIYFNCRDTKNRSHVATVELNIFTREFRALSTEPLLSPGLPGYFDDSGLSLGSLVVQGGKRYLYYVGWNLMVTIPFRNSIGLAVNHGDGRGFVKHSHAPIVDRTDVDPTNLSYPFVLKEEKGFRMWYGADLKSNPDKEKMKHTVKYAESQDGVSWAREGVIAVPLKDEQELGVSRPGVLKGDDGYDMWYCFRYPHKEYHLGYAHSTDGVTWNRRDDEVELVGEQEDWDSETQCYPFVFEHGGQKYMLYCGNGYGREGFGLAVCDG